MKKFAALIAGLSLLALSSCSKQPTTDFTTPEGAILTLEDAYRKKDLQAAVDAKDFAAESRVMLSTFTTPLDKDQEIVEKSAKVLELGFRAEMQNKGFPDFSGVRSYFTKTEPYKDFQDIVAVTEMCMLPDGRTSTQKLLVAKTTRGWRVLNVVE